MDGDHCTNPEAAIQRIRRTLFENDVKSNVMLRFVCVVSHSAAERCGNSLEQPLWGVFGPFRRVYPGLHAFVVLI